MTQNLVGLAIGTLMGAIAWCSASAEPESLMQRFTPVSEQLVLDPSSNVPARS